jgi:hypothetical protein
MSTDAGYLEARQIDVTLHDGVVSTLAGTGEEGFQDGDSDIQW